MRNKVKVLGVSIDAVTMDKAINIVEDFIADKNNHLIATANAEMVMLARKDNDLAQILQKADLVVPDGAGVVWAARYNGSDVPERVAGYDMVQRLLAVAATKGYGIFMFGGAPGVVEMAKQTAESQYPGVKIVGLRNGFFSKEEESAIVNEINSSSADVLLVALGVPKQEKWLARNLSKLSVPVSIGVGGTFDVMAGNVKRAPLWMQRASLEWLYRLMSQPQRVIRMLALPQFVFSVIRQKTLDKSKLGIL